MCSPQCKDNNHTDDAFGINAQHDSNGIEAAGTKNVAFEESGEKGLRICLVIFYYIYSNYSNFEYIVFAYTGT